MLTKILRHDSKGASLAEFALAAPVLLLMAMGAADFARVMVESAQMEGAANAGATWGYRTVRDAMDLSGIRSAVLNDASSVGNLTPIAQRLCDCPTSPGVWVSCTDTICSGYGFPRVYVRAGAEKNFTTLGRYPGIPSQIHLKSAGYMRVQ